MTSAILGIDPGLGGGIAFQVNGKTWAERMPETDRDILDLLNSFEADVTTAYIEQIPMFVAAIPSSAAIKLGMNYGKVLMACAALKHRIVDVTPQRWQKHFSLGNKKSHASTNAWKNHIKQKAQRLFPDLSITLQTSDALMLLAYGNEIQR